jgi:hypothetical protein
MTFVVGGDMFHAPELLDAMNKRAGAEDPLFALLGGDLAYGNGILDVRWFDWVDSWKDHAVAPDGRMIPMIVVIGNHEVRGVGYRPRNPPGREAAPFFYSLFRGQEGGARTAVDFGTYLSVVGLDSGHTATIASQTNWLEKTLRERTRVPWLFACYHRPAWGSGVKPDATEIQDAWSPLFEKFQVDAVFENDHHVYKRTRPILGGEVDDKRGILYLGDGAWGVGVRPVPGDWATKRPWLSQARSINHLLKVTLTKKGFKCEAMTADGEVFDRIARPLRRR